MSLDIRTILREMHLAGYLGARDDASRQSVTVTPHALATLMEDFVSMYYADATLLTESLDSVALADELLVKLSAFYVDADDTLVIPYGYFTHRFLFT